MPFLGKQGENRLIESMTHIARQPSPGPISVGAGKTRANQSDDEMIEMGHSLFLFSYYAVPLSTGSRK
jgi:hypothetical protein